MQVSKKDLEILSALGKRAMDPLNSISKLAGVSPMTLSRRLERLYRDGVLIGVSAEINHSSLGLTEVYFFIEANFRHLETIEAAVDRHPYARYRVRCLGSTNGVFATFSVPNGTLPHLLEFVYELKQLGLVTDYRHELSVSSWGLVETDYKRYDPVGDSWDVDWGVWEEGIPREPEPLEASPSILHLLDERDMRVLRQLTVDVRVKRKEMAAEAGVPDYHLSRRLRFYRDRDVIRSFRVVVHRSASRLFSTHMFECRCPVKVTEMVGCAMRELPFQSTLVPTQSGFLLQAALPSLDFPRLGRALQRRCENVRVTWGDYESSMRYYLQAEAFREGAWNTDRGYTVQKSLEPLKGT